MSIQSHRQFQPQLLLNPLQGIWIIPILNNMNEIDLESLSFDIDGELNRFALDHEADPLSVAAVVLARSMLYTRHFECEEEFKKLLRNVLDDRPADNRFLQ